MKLKRVKKLLAIALVGTMVLTASVIANAGTYSHSYSFYVDSVGGNGYSSSVKKQDSHGYAYSDLDKVSFNGPSSGLNSRIYDYTQGKIASNSRNSYYTGLFQYTYKSGFASTSDSMRFNGYTSTSCGYGATIQGTWTPNSY